MEEMIDNVISELRDKLRAKESEIEGLKAENERLKKIINQPKDQWD